MCYVLTGTLNPTHSLTHPINITERLLAVTAEKVAIWSSGGLQRLTAV